MFVVSRSICGGGGGGILKGTFGHLYGTCSSIAASPSGIMKVIAAQPDPLLAKEIFDLASSLPDFRHPYPTYVILVSKLGKAGHFDLMDSILSTLKSTEYPISPSLFQHIIRIYGDARLPDKARDTFYTMLDFNINPTSHHFNQILIILLSYPHFIGSAFHLFRQAHLHAVFPDTQSYNLLMRASCFTNRLHVAHSLFNHMFKTDILPDTESYRILIQGFCRKAQLNTALNLFEDMLNKGLVPDALSYTTLFNNLCRKKRLKEAYKLLSRMTLYGCHPDIVHYNTLIQGFCREGRSVDACKILTHMSLNGCLPNLVSYRTLVTGLCSQGKYLDAKIYIQEMLSKGFSPHYSVVHALVRGSCSTGFIDEAVQVLENVLQHGETPVAETWLEVISRVCVVDDTDCIDNIVKEVMKI